MPPDGKPDVLLLATGSEVYLCVQAYEQLDGRRREGARGEHAELGTVRAADPRSIARRCCRRR